MEAAGALRVQVRDGSVTTCRSVPRRVVFPLFHQRYTTNILVRLLLVVLSLIVLSKISVEFQVHQHLVFIWDQIHLMSYIIFSATRPVCIY